MSNGTYFVEYAKSNRAACKGPCRGNILQGHLRLGYITNKGEYNHTSWICFPECTTKQVATHCLNKHPDTSILGGMELLTEDDQQRVDAALRALQQGDKVVPWQDVDGDKKKAAPAAKKKKAPAPRRHKKSRYESDDGASSEDTSEEEQTSEEETSEDEEEETSEEEEEEEEEEVKPRARRASAAAKKKKPAAKKKPAPAAAAKKKKKA